MKLIILPATFQQEKGGSVTGIIYFEGDSFVFPDVNWYDFPVVLLAWWTQAVLNLRSQRGLQKVYFMEGPYRVVTQQTGSEVRLSFQRNEIEIGFVSTTLEKITDEVREASATMLDWVRQKQIESKDIDELARLFSNL